LEAQDAAIIIAACGGLVVAILAPLLKALVDIRRQTAETNIAVNHRPHGEATLREVVQEIQSDLSRFRDDQRDRHTANVVRMERVDSRLCGVEGKIDRLGSAVAGANDRLDKLEQFNQGTEGTV
jgi:hypothetical protein